MDCRKTDWSDKESFLDIMAPLTELRGGRRPSKVGGTPGTARKDVSTSVMLVDWMGVGMRVNEEQEDWDRLVEEYLIKVENTTGSTSKEDNILILEDDLRKEEDILLVEDDLGDPVNLHDDHHGHGDQEHIRRMVYLTKGVSSSLLLVRMI